MWKIIILLIAPKILSDLFIILLIALKLNLVFVYHNVYTTKNFFVLLVSFVYYITYIC